jgi:hypothetical protein
MMRRSAWHSLARPGHIGKFIFRLADRCLQTHDAKLDGIKRRLAEEMKFLPRSERRGQAAIGHGKLRQNPEQALRLLSSFDLFLLLVLL